MSDTSQTDPRWLAKLIAELQGAGTCRLLGLNPVTYLSNIVPKLARGVERDDLATLMPKAWLQAHPAAAMAPLR